MVYQRAVSLFLCRKYRSDISGITTKAPCEAALMGERHVRIEISDFVMRTFVLLYSASLPSALSLWITSSILWTTLTKSSSL